MIFVLTDTFLINNAGGAGLERSRGAETFLLPCPGPEMPGIFHHLFALQNQAYTLRRSRENWLLKGM